MNTQNQLLIWIYRNENNFPLKAGRIYQAFQVTEDYNATQATFSEKLGKLESRNLLDKPDYGTYDINEKGVRYCKNLLNESTEELDRPEEYSDIVDRLDRFFLEEKNSDIADANISGEDFVLSLEELEVFDPDLIESFEEFPRQFLDAVDEALELNCETSVPEVCIRPDTEWLRMSMEEARNSSKMGRPVIVEGIVKRSEQVSHLIDFAVFECNQCGDRYKKDQDSTQLKSPYKCECGSKRFEPVDKHFSNVIDFEISHRDEMETTLFARLLGSPDLEKEVQKDLMTGSKVKVLGIIRENINDKGSKNSRKLDCSLDVIDYVRSDKKKDISEISDEKKQNVIETVKESNDPFEDFAESIAPGLGNLETPKKCIAASLIGSPEIESEGVGSKDYGRIHTGIIANPGLGKSELLNWVKSTFSKTFKAEGKSGSGTGLTATAEQSNGGEWRLVAGKLVFADRGILEIDEFDKFEEGELTSLNTAMESGFFNVDKASVSAELPGRATVIAAGNFAGKLDEYTPPYEILPKKGEGLYDRFALMCAITESGDEAHESISERFKSEDGSSADPVFDEDEIRVYRDLMQECDPLLTDESYQPIKSFIDACGNKSGGELQGESNRFLVNLIKLTLSIARANLREEEALPEDAMKAVELKKETRKTLGLDSGDRGTATEFKEHRKQQTVKDQLDDLAEQSDGEEVDETELIERVQDRSSMGENEIKQVLSSLKREGELWEPENGFVARV